MCNEMRPIIVLGALDFELYTVIAALEGREATELCGFPVVSGRLDDYPVIAARTKVGTVNTALLTTLLIDRFHPLCLVSQGTAGSHLPSLHVGDVILGEQVVSINACHMDERDCRELEMLCREEWQEHRCYASSPALLSAAERTGYGRGRLIRGVIGTGDFWTHGSEAIRAIQERYGTFCEEMESFAAAQVCALTGTPFLCLRIVSNNELTGEKFEDDLAQTCQSYVLDTVRTLIREMRSGTLFSAD